MPKKKKEKTELKYTIGAGYHVQRSHAESLFAVIRDKYKGEKPTPEELVKEARKKRSPIHGLFEWDEPTAAKRYRYERAQYYLRAIQVIEIVIDTSEIVRGPVRAFVPTIVEKHGRIPPENYIPVQRLSEDKLSTKYVLDRAKADFMSLIFRYRRYAAFLEVFDPVIRAFDAVQEQLESEKKKKVKKKKVKKKK